MLSYAENTDLLKNMSKQIVDSDEEDKSNREWRVKTITASNIYLTNQTVKPTQQSKHRFIIITSTFPVIIWRFSCN